MDKKLRAKGNNRCRRTLGEEGLPIDLHPVDYDASKEGMPQDMVVAPFAEVFQPSLLSGFIVGGSTQANSAAFSQFVVLVSHR